MADEPKTDDTWQKFGDENPDAVQLRHELMLCPLHGEPYRAHYPKGYPIFLVEAFRAVTEIESAWDDARRLMPDADRAELGDNSPPTRAMERALAVKPACCRLDAKKLVELYTLSNVGVMRRCTCCHRKQLGTPYKTTELEIAHLCFVCVTTRISATDPRLQ